MTKEEIALNKLDILMRSISEAEQQSETLEELKAAAFEVLLLHPGSTPQEWDAALCKQYAMELMDAYGSDPKAVHDGLAKLWNTKYRDINSGLEYTYNQWAEAFATEASVQMYYDLTQQKSQ